MGDTDVIYSYTLEQALEDGILVKPFGIYNEKFMARYVGNKPIVATAHLFNEIKYWEFLDIWNQFIIWRQDIMPTLPEEDRMFSMVVNNKKVWVDETESQITFMYPEDY